MRRSIGSEVASGAGQIEDVQMSLFNAIKGTVPYAEAAYFGKAVPAGPPVPICIRPDAPAGLVMPGPVMSPR